MREPILCFGHSHMVALRAGHLWRVRHGEAAADDMEFVPLNDPPCQLRTVLVEGRRELAPDLVEHVSTLLAGCRPKAVVLLVTGNEHNILGLFRHPDTPAPPDVDWPESGLPLAEGRDRVPADLLFAEMQNQLDRANFRFCRWIAGQVDCPLVIVGPPPPIVDEAHIRAHPGVFADRMDKLEIAPADFRHKLWRIDARLRQDLAAELGAAFVPAPAAAIADLGLAERLRGNDPTHGNQEYGRMLLADVLAALAAARTEESA